jgi:hypothetical protein
MQLSIMSSDVEMDDSSHSDGDVELDLEVILAPNVLVARKRDPAHLVYVASRPHFGCYSVDRICLGM